mmetsp:Transcript_43084/g.69938  ORF Transcript_43084/g.69938 Transcript_43084/m.69938 type:complete len:143 (-) Transcript_43084:405-833(-)
MVLCFHVKKISKIHFIYGIAARRPPTVAVVTKINTLSQSKGLTDSTSVPATLPAARSINSRGVLIEGYQPKLLKNARYKEPVTNEKSNIAIEPGHDLLLFQGRGRFLPRALPNTSANPSPAQSTHTTATATGDRQNSIVARV